ncbi:MAG: DinB family protein [Pseudomonadota bacterium]
MSASTLLLSLFKYKAWANAELFAELQKLDPVTHHAERHAAIRILNHIFVVDRIFAAHLSGSPHSYAATNTVETPAMEELQSAVIESDGWYVDYISKLPPELLPENVTFDFTDGGQGRMSREEILVHVATHGGYHRGAVGGIMNRASVPPPRDIFTAYLHQSEPERRVSHQVS